MLEARQSQAERPLWLSMRADRFSPDHLLRYFDIVAPPVNVFDVARRMGVEVRFERLEPKVSGILTASEQRAVMRVARGDPEVRQRFTVAHELGHLMKHPLGGEMHRDVFEPGLPSQPEEREANVFAANLLMPEWMVRPAVDQLGANLAALAKRFGVSESAMELRLRALYRR